MPSGSPEPEDKRAAFRASYLYSGNASASARTIGIPERTGREWAEALSDDESFAEERRSLRERAKHELLAMRMEVARISLERLREDVVAPDVSDDANVTIIDKRADYGKLVLEAEKNAIALDRYSDQTAPPPTNVTINVSGPPGTSVEHSSG